MSDKNFGQDIVDQTTKGTVDGTWTYGGEEYDLVAEDITKSDLDLIEQYAELSNRVAQGGEVSEEEIEELDDFSWESEDNNDRDWLESVLHDKLEKPSVDNPDEQPMRKLRALLEGMMKAWVEADDVAGAKGEMPLDEGNR